MNKEIIMVGKNMREERADNHNKSHEENRR